VSPSSLKVVHLSNKAWDTSRSKHTDALDAILESLGTQLVPPEFHQSPEDSSLFGSQHSDPEAEASHKHKRTPQKKANGPLVSPQSPSATLRHHEGCGSLKEDKSKGEEEIYKGKKDDRKRWKTLRDFVDDQAIEDIYETIEDDRTALDVRGELPIFVTV
jgi:autophagy-related protein 17